MISSSTVGDSTDPRAGRRLESLMKVETRIPGTVRRKSSKSEKLERASPDTAQALGKRFFPRLAGVAQMTASDINTLHRSGGCSAVSATPKAIVWQDQNGRTLCPKCRRCAQASEALDPMRVDCRPAKRPSQCPASAMHLFSFLFWI